MPLSEHMLELQLNEYRLVLNEAPPHSVDSTDNLNSYDRIHILGDNAYLTNHYSLTCYRDDEHLGVCLLQSCGGSSGVHQHSAVSHGQHCYIAIGPYIIDIDIPSFDLNWTIRADDATCFGIHSSPEHNCLISHGELMIARLSYTGEIEWRTAGADIFTNGFQIDGNVVCAIDFNDREYQFNIGNGRETAA